jgi:hypothetical protein
MSLLLRQKKTSFIFGLGGDVFLTRAKGIPQACLAGSKKLPLPLSLPIKGREIQGEGVPSYFNLIPPPLMGGGRGRVIKIGKPRMPNASLLFY